MNGGLEAPTHQLVEFIGVCVKLAGRRAVVLKIPIDEAGILCIKSIPVHARVREAESAVTKASEWSETGAPVRHEPEHI